MSPGYPYGIDVNHAFKFGYMLNSLSRYSSLSLADISTAFSNSILFLKWKYSTVSTLVSKTNAYLLIFFYDLHLFFIFIKYLTTIKLNNDYRFHLQFQQK